MRLVPTKLSLLSHQLYHACTCTPWIVRVRRKRQRSPKAREAVRSVTRFCFPEDAGELRKKVVEPPPVFNVTSQQRDIESVLTNGGGGAGRHSYCGWKCKWACGPLAGSSFLRWTPGRASPPEPIPPPLRNIPLQTRCRIAIRLNLSPFLQGLPLPPLLQRHSLRGFNVPPPPSLEHQLHPSLTSGDRNTGHHCSFTVNPFSPFPTFVSET